MQGLGHGDRVIFQVEVDFYSTINALTIVYWYKTLLSQCVTSSSQDFVLI